MKRVQWVLLILASVTSVASAQINVGLPTLTAKRGDTLLISIMVDDLTSSDILAYQFAIAFDHDVVSMLDAVTSATLSEQTSWSVLSNVGYDSIVVGAYGAQSLRGSGVLLKLRCQVIGNAGAKMVLTFRSFIFNAGAPLSIMKSGGIDIITGVPNPADNIPAKFDLLPNYPNPFNPKTVVRYSLPENSHVALKVYDVQGCEIATLAEEEKPAGHYSVEFDGKNLASGVYLCVIEARSFSRLNSRAYTGTTRMLLMR